jgi:NitT/TauT family transport system permease protein
VARTLRRVGLLAVIITAWELYGRSVQPIFFPTFSSTLGVFVEATTTGALPAAILKSLEAMSLGFGLALAFAIPLGFIMGRYRTADYVLQMYVTVVLALPMVAIFPFIIVVLGLSLEARVAIVFLFVFVYVMVDTAAGIRATPVDLIEMGRSFMLSERQQFRLIRIPSAGPLIMAGVRLGFGRSLTGMLLGELLLAGVGLGQELNEAAHRYDTARMFAAVLALLLLAVVGTGLIQQLDRRIHRWRPEIST